MGRCHPIAMASGIMPEATPQQLVEAAAEAGFDFGGMWIEPDLWTDATTRSVRSLLRETGLELLDVEVVWLQAGPPDPDHLRIVDIAAELGARNVLCVSSDPERSRTRDKLGQLTERASQGETRVSLEFGLFTEVRTIEQASELLRELPSAALLIDSLHWSRSGGTLHEIAATPPEWLSYAQLCDAPARGPDPLDTAAILREAIDGRLPLGRGGLPLGPFVDLLPDGIPLAIEERSKPLRDAFPDLVDRARAVLQTSRAFLDGLGGARTVN